ncbi:MAG: TraB/GumN family protein [Flavobacteriales bacterium]|nr:TraB/GumN family protein [Flavobacteriales bacterium]
MKYIKHLGWILLLVPCLFAFRQQEASVEKNSLFWEITGNRLKQPSYLFGTIHLITEKYFFMPNIVTDKFGDCKVLATEINMDMTMAQKIDLAVKTLLPNNETIANHMDSTSFVRLKKYMVEEANIKESKAEKYMRLKPFFLSSVILVEQLDDIKSYEEEFMKMAKKNKMTTIGLESINYQFDVIDKVSIENQVKLLMDGLEEEGGENQFDTLIKLYLSQNIDSLSAYSMAESDYIPDFKLNFLDTRNANWIPVIEELIKDKSVFIAVGAGHLAGDTGVIALLEAQGYSVKPLRD